MAHNRHEKVASEGPRHPGPRQLTEGAEGWYGMDETGHNGIYHTFNFLDDRPFKR